jgi:putative DNA primase/helicase
MDLADKKAKKMVDKTSKWDKGKDRLLPTYNNVINFLEESEHKIRYNTFGSYVEFNGERYTDHHTLRLKEQMRPMKLEPTLNIIDEAIVTTALRNSFHPVKEYLESIKWDGINRVESFLTTCAGAENNKYTRLMSTFLLVAPIYRVYQPGYQHDTMIILEGDQGTGKSKLVRALGGQWYKAISLMDRDHNTIQLMQGSWIIEVPELSVFAKRDIESLKAFISNPIDFTRFAFGRQDKAFPRQSVFVGTINPESNGYLMDPTGNRRFLPVKLGAINIELIESMRDQVFAEALLMYKSGVPVHVTNEELSKIVITEQYAREFHDDWSTIIYNYININRNDMSRFMTAGDIYNRALNGENVHYDQRIGRRIANLMKRMGCDDPQHTFVNGIQGKYFDVSKLWKTDAPIENLNWDTETR